MVTNGLAHGEGSPFNAQTGSLRVALPLAHSVAQGGIHELQGGSFKQGFISGVIGKLGGGIVHANVQTQTLQAGGMIIVSGIAAAASGANSRDAVMRSAISVITIYLYNDSMSFKDKMTKGWSIFRKVEFKEGVQAHLADHSNGHHLAGGASGSASGFVGVSGVSLSSGVIVDTNGNQCLTSTVCMQFGLGAFGGSGASYSGAYGEALSNGNAETWGVFINGGAGLLSGGVSADFSQEGAGIGKGFVGPGSGIAAGVQFCDVKVYGCD